MVHTGNPRIGVGRALLAAAEAHALAHGCCKLTLEVLSGNDVAQALYRSFGFEAYSLDPARGGALFWEKKLSR
jgi:ribosomal protein S18 acetylase RimI-like enzyme